MDMTDVPDTWDYTVVLREPIEDRESVAERVLGMGASTGYTLADTPWVLDMEGEEHSFTTRDGVLHFLATHGGLVTPWRERGHDIYVSFDWEGRSISLGVLDPPSPDKSGPDDPGRGRSIGSLEAMFTTLCKALKPAYGYSSDEWMPERALGARGFLAKWNGFEQAVRDGRAPPLLFWLNYFPTDYFERVGETRLATIAHRIVPLGEDGVLVYLSDHPWDGRMALLDEDGRRYVAAFH
jgi:hypothetical protein